MSGDILFVMAGLVPAIHDFLLGCEARRGCPADQGVTPVFDGLWPGMTELRLMLA
jgi:hypothetical protein